MGRMSDEAVPAEKRRLILSFARPGAYVPLARAILGRMGYAIVTSAEWEESQELRARPPELGVVEDRRFGELPESQDFAALPLILIASQGGPNVVDRRLVGAVPCPAGLHELYRLLQQALEPVARSAMRVPTNLPVRMRQAGREWLGAVLSLSENGCLVRSPEPMMLGAELEVCFELPRSGLIETRAESAYQLVADTGLVFQSTPAASRRAILSFVEQQLIA
jgi:hypothetical protein